MAILEVVQYDHPSLRAKCREVSKKRLRSKEFRRLVKDLTETMYARDGVGLAAPQVAVEEQVTVIDTSWPQGEASTMVLINPQIVFYEGELLSQEGCLSFRGQGEIGVQLSQVKRYRRVKVNYQSPDNERLSIIADGDLLSRCLQHEIDHLNGVLFIDRTDDRDEVATELARCGLPPAQGAQQPRSGTGDTDPG